MIYCISDIHGHYREFYHWIDQLGSLKSFKDGQDKLILLGDYIDRGPDSYKVLDLIYNLSLSLGDALVVLRGNHEDWFLEWLAGNGDDWPVEDESLMTSRTFLTDQQMDEVKRVVVDEGYLAALDFIRECINNNHKKIIAWMRNLRPYYKTKTQIFVHAGVDEEAGDWWETGTPDYVFTGKYPATIGHFYMDIIAGHIAAATIAGKRNFDGVYYDGKSHYYIDGSVERTGNLLCLVCDDENGKYYELLKDDTPHGTNKQSFGKLKMLN